jgi:bifunctional UDP-N-acetylglucosamine pyrophosphorylase/glucosamine-1-phosphate N-acetyltransferase
MTKTSTRLAVVVLAGGQSKRFGSPTPKVVHPLLGRPLIGHVVQTLAELHRSSKLAGVTVVVPPGKLVEAALAGQPVPFHLSFAVQRLPRGTGDAARVALAKLPKATEVLVIAGDSPLLQASTLHELVRQRRASGAAAAVLTAILDDPGDYGRVVRDGGRVAEIVEAPDATIAQRHIREINTSTYVFARDALAAALPKLRTNNVQGEYYLTDAVRLLVGAGRPVVAVQGGHDEALGTNTRRDYALVLGRLRRRVLARLMDAGVTILDPNATYVDVDVAVGADTVLRPNTSLEGSTRIGAGCDIGPNVWLIDTTVGDGASVMFATARAARVRAGARVGPFADLTGAYTDPGKPKPRKGT